MFFQLIFLIGIINEKPKHKLQWLIGKRRLHNQILNCLFLKEHGTVMKLNTFLRPKRLEVKHLEQVTILIYRVEITTNIPAIIQ